jgi:hypothetical protein
LIFLLKNMMKVCVIINYASSLQQNLTGGMAMAGKAHPGFKSVQASIARKEGISKQAAGAILANSTRHASAAAKRKNPNLKRVPTKKKG